MKAFLNLTAMECGKVTGVSVIFNGSWRTTESGSGATSTKSKWPGRTCCAQKIILYLITGPVGGYV